MLRALLLACAPLPLCALVVVSMPGLWHCWAQCFKEISAPMTGSSQLSYPAITLIAGIGIPIMAAMNAHLGARLGNPVAASVVLFLVGLIAGVMVLGFTDLPSSATVLAAPRLYFLGGLLMAFYVLSITWVAPRFGVGNAIFFVLLGQLISASIIDHFGLFGAQAVPIEGRRIIGLVLMAAGVFLARRIV